MLSCGALVWAGLWVLITGMGLGPFFVVEIGLVSSAAVIVHGIWTTTTYLLLAVWYYESADRAKRATAVFRESKLARQSAERWLLELRLGARQARLDPQVLFDALDEAGRLYRSRPAAAELLLDALIDYLRLALPQQRQSESTLSREIALAVAYARVLRIPNEEPLGLDSNVAVGVGDARFPPMVVQPLCDAMARSTIAGGAPARMQISASLDNAGARLRITAHPTRTALAGKRLEEIRHTLLAMFGPFVRMDATGPAAGVISVLVEVPYDPAPRVDR
jgi:LytS/YehU family sensor histidine kinase